MLKRFSLKNYRNFKDEIMINFEDIAGYQFNTECITDYFSRSAPLIHSLSTISKYSIYG
ncbi:hypothetical protein Aargi30884_24530 [Amedibacterium intestinale]|uniref:Uncharacterized protein n=1 Tax=Amedibacterium intestinale TaxID=2583452 RepID=A0A6N4TKI4_9FIRM|nr:hypothetical protein Aargi30884_24530 [Amedibacterium intestinale]